MAFLRANGFHRSEPATLGELRVAKAYPLFCAEKKARQKRKSFKAETIKRLSPRSKCYYISHSRIFRIQKFFLSAKDGGRQYHLVFYDPSTLKSISSALQIFSSQFSFIASKLSLGFNHYELFFAKQKFPIKDKHISFSGVHHWRGQLNFLL